MVRLLQNKKCATHLSCLSAITSRPFLLVWGAGANALLVLLEVYAKAIKILNVHIHFSGVDHLLPSEEFPSETKMACYMILLMQLADKAEVLRVSPIHKEKLQNYLSNAVVQSATQTSTPLLDAGLDGEGEVIQVR